MSDLHRSEHRLFEALIQADGALKATVEENRDDAGELLEYLYLGDVASYVAGLANSAEGQGSLNAILAALEDALDGDEHVTNLVCVGFLEMLKANGGLATVRARFGPRLGFWADTV
jgi:hypothetical protein